MESTTATAAEITQRKKDKANQIFLTIQVNIELGNITHYLALALTKQVRDLVVLDTESATAQIERQLVINCENRRALEQIGTLLGYNLSSTS